MYVVTCSTNMYLYYTLGKIFVSASLCVITRFDRLQVQGGIFGRQKHDLLLHVLCSVPNNHVIVIEGNWNRLVVVIRFAM